MKLFRHLGVRIRPFSRRARAPVQDGPHQPRLFCWLSLHVFSPSHTPSKLPALWGIPSAPHVSRSLLLWSLLLLSLYLSLTFLFAHSTVATRSPAGFNDSLSQGTPVNASTGIPGSRLRTVEEVEAFRRRLECVTREGTWVMDPSPRLLPWAYDEGNFGHCDGRWLQHPGRVARDDADAVALSRRPAAEWTVRPSNKYVWVENETKCGAKLKPFSSRALAATLTNTSGQNVEKERVLLMVGDSMQHAYAVAVYDNMRMGLGGALKEEMVPLAPSSLPCHNKRIAHRRMCFGVHFFAKSRPGTRLVFARNDFLSLVSQATWAAQGKHFELPWIETLKGLLKQDFHWLEGGVLEAPKRGAKNTVADYKARPRAPHVLPPVLLLNRGVHYVEDSRFFPELNASMRAAREACPQCLIIFRNTPGGHKNCFKYSLPLTSRHPDTDLPFNWTEVGVQSRNPLTRQIVESVGGVFLDVEAMTSLRADGHTGRNRQGTKDCTHYCAPGPLDTWVRLLFHVLSELL